MTDSQKFKAWNMRAQLLLESLQSDRISGNYSEGLPPEAENEVYKDFFDGIAECINLEELENLVNEAENLDIYDQNSLYDKLVDYHINTLEVQKQIRRAWQMRRNINVTKALDMIRKVIINGVRLREAEDLLVYLSLGTQLEDAKSKTVSLEELTTLIDKAKQFRDLISPEDLVLLQSRKDIFLKIQEKMKKYYTEITSIAELNDKQIKPILQEVKKYKMKSKEIKQMQLLVTLSDSLRKLYSALNPHDHLVQHRPLSTLLQQSAVKLADLKNILQVSTDLFLSRFDETSERICAANLATFKESIQHCDSFTDFDELEDFYRDCNLIVWKSTAIRLLNKKEAEETLILNCVENTPEEEEGSKERMLLQERLHCLKTARTQEEMVKKNLNIYWEMNIDEIVANSSRIKVFLESMTGFYNDRKLELEKEFFLNALNVLTKDTITGEDITSLEAIDIDNVFDHHRPIMHEIEKMSSDYARVDKTKNFFEELIRKNERAQAHIEDANNLRIVCSLPRVTLQKAKTYKYLAEELTPKLRGNFNEFIMSLNDGITKSERFSLEVADFERRYKTQALLDRFSEERSDTARYTEIARLYNLLIDKYRTILIRDDYVEGCLKDKEVVLQAFSMLLNFPFRGARKDISSWQMTISKLQATKSQNTLQIIKEMQEKMQYAEKLLMEAHKMRQFENQIEGLREAEKISIQDKMMSVEELRSMISNYEADRSGVEVHDTMNYLKGILEDYAKITKQTASPSSLKELEEIGTVVLSIPLKIETHIRQGIQTLLFRAQELRGKLKRAILNSPDTVIREFAMWDAKFSDLGGLVVEEWNAFKDSYFKEKQLLAELPARINHCDSIEELDSLRDRYSSHSILRKESAELSLLLKRIEFVQKEYEKKLFDEECELHRILTVNQLNELNDKINNVLEEHLHESDRSHLIFNPETKQKFSFITKMKKDVDKFIIEKIDGSSTLKELEINIKKNPYGEIIDFGELVTERQAVLAASDRNRFADRQLKETRNSVSYTIKHLIDSNPIFAQSRARLNTTQIAKTLEREIYDLCVSRATKYEDFGKSSCKIMEILHKYPHISKKLEEKKFNLRLIEQLFYKSKEELDDLESNFYSKEVKEAAVPKDDFTIAQVLHPPTYNYFRIFEGNLFFGLSTDGVHKHAENSLISSCAPRQFFSGFSVIPNNLLLNTKVKLSEFQRYIEKAILSDNYSVVPGWINMANGTQMAAKKYFEKNMVVASSQYSRRCKLFVISKEHLRPEWLKAVNFYVAKNPGQEILLYVFFVLKKTEQNEYEVQLIPQELEPEGCKLLKVFSMYNKIFEKEIEKEELLDGEQPYQQFALENSYDQNSLGMETPTANEYQDRNPNIEHQHYYRHPSVQQQQQFSKPNVYSEWSDRRPQLSQNQNAPSNLLEIIRVNPNISNTLTPKPHPYRESLEPPFLGKRDIDTRYRGTRDLESSATVPYNYPQKNLHIQSRQEQYLRNPQFDSRFKAVSRDPKCESSQPGYSRYRSDQHNLG